MNVKFVFSFLIVGNKDSLKQHEEGPDNAMVTWEVWEQYGADEGIVSGMRRSSTLTEIYVRPSISADLTSFLLNSNETTTVCLGSLETSLILSTTRMINGRKTLNWTLQMAGLGFTCYLALPPLYLDLACIFRNLRTHPSQSQDNQ